MMHGRQDQRHRLGRRDTMPQPAGIHLVRALGQRQRARRVVLPAFRGRILRLAAKSSTAMRATTRATCRWMKRAISSSGASRNFAKSGERRDSRTAGDKTAGRRRATFFQSMAHSRSENGFRTGAPCPHNPGFPRTLVC